MIVDTSAVVAILAGEPEREALLEALVGSGPHVMSAATWLECAVVVDGRKDPLLARRMEQLLADLDVTVVPLTAEQAAIGRAAHRDYGRGSGSPARLSLGDCFTYALASQRREALAFVDDDFTHTDLVPGL